MINDDITQAKDAAVKVLLHNKTGPHKGLPRTAGWGYPEPYTRDLMLSMLGIAHCNNKELINAWEKTFKSLADNQSRLGHIPSLAHDAEERGASDTTPLFLMAVAVYRKLSGKKNFLAKAVNKALTWMEYQSPSDRLLVGQLPTSDWRDEQWVLGYGLYVNTLVYSYLRLYGLHDKAESLKKMMFHLSIKEEDKTRARIEGLKLKNKPYYALWSYKIYNSERFDLLGNSLAVLTGIASPDRAEKIIAWIENECKTMQEQGELAVGMPPNFFPYITPEDPDWRPRYTSFNKPGEYHNGGIWPFICGFYIAALVAAEKYKPALEKLYVLTDLVKLSKTTKEKYGFNEWIKAQDGTPHGNDWQTWSAAMYLYAAACVEKKRTPYFDEIRENSRI
jgi:hypothetical protein